MNYRTIGVTKSKRKSRRRIGVTSTQCRSNGSIIWGNVYRSRFAIWNDFGSDGGSGGSVYNIGGRCGFIGNGSSGGSNRKFI